MGNIGSGVVLANGLSKPYQKVVATNGGSTTINDGVLSLLLVPAATIAGHTVTMPAHPGDGQVISIGSTQIVTTLTLQGNSGQTIDSAITAFAAGGSASYQYVASDTKWYKVGS